MWHQVKNQGTIVWILYPLDTWSQLVTWGTQSLSTLRLRQGHATAGKSCQGNCKNLSSQHWLEDTFLKKGQGRWRYLLLSQEGGLVGKLLGKISTLVTMKLGVLCLHSRVSVKTRWKGTHKSQWRNVVKKLHSDKHWLILEEKTYYNSI